MGAVAVVATRVYFPAGADTVGRFTIQAEDRLHLPYKFFDLRTANLQALTTVEDPRPDFTTAMSCRSP